jgi:quercetin dioxygenase-like cupin family protein
VSKKKSSPARHDGQEWLQVVKGTIAFTLGDETIDLSSGDAIQFDASVPHFLRPTSKAPVRILLVSTTASRSLPH